MTSVPASDSASVPWPVARTATCNRRPGRQTGTANVGGPGESCAVGGCLRVALAAVARSEQRAQGHAGGRRVPALSVCRRQLRAAAPARGRPGPPRGSTSRSCGFPAYLGLSEAGRAESARCLGVRAGCGQWERERDGCERRELRPRPPGQSGLAQLCRDAHVL